MAYQGRGDVRTRQSSRPAKGSGVLSGAPAQAINGGCEAENKLVTKAKVHRREGPNLWGCERKLQSSSPIGFKSCPGHGGLG